MIKTVLLAAAVVGCVFGANTACWTIDQIADEVMRQGDKNGDGVMDMVELQQELFVNWNLGNDSRLTMHDFVAAWTHHFHDHQSTAHEFFTRLDTDQDHYLTLADVVPLIIKYDANSNALVEDAEFRAFLHAYHPDSTTNGGHGHGCH